MLLKPQPQFVVYWVVQAKGVQKSVLSFELLWPLEVAEVAKGSLDNIFWQKVNFHNFWATSMLYTSKERIFHVEFKFKQKKLWFIIGKFEKKE